jgi:membrane-associated protease RseP (regulator of RpoE activity)
VAGSHPQAPGPDGARGGFLGVELEETEADSGSDTSSAAPGTAAGATPSAEPDGPGVLIAGVVPDSAAWFAGLEPRDRLLAIDGQVLTNRADLVGAVASKEPGSLIELKYQRDGAEHSARVRLGRRGPQGLLDSLGALGPFGALHGRLGPSGIKVQRIDGLGPLGQLDQLGRFDPMGQLDPVDLSSLMSLQGLDLDSAEGLQLRIDGDRMTIERDGQSEHYERGADGQWRATESHGDTDGIDVAADAADDTKA